MISSAPFVSQLVKQHPELKVNALIRSDKLDAELQKLNVTVHHGSTDDYALLTKLASQHDIVVNAVSSSDSKMSEAIVEGLKGHTGTLLHVSGTGNFMDGRQLGKKVEGDDVKWWSDESVDDMKAINSAMPNGGPDALILKAASEGLINAFIVSPACVYGPSALNDLPGDSKGVFITWNIQNASSLGYAPYVGDGSSVFQAVHVDDVIRLMLSVFEKAIEAKASGNVAKDAAYKRYYIAGGPEVNWKSFATSLAKALQKAGKIESDQPKSVNMADAGFLGGLIAANMFVKMPNAISAGFELKGKGILEMVDELKV